MAEIVILELPADHVDIILQMLEFGMQNASVESGSHEKLKEIREHILRQIKT